jgi:hypothetical protein
MPQAAEITQFIFGQPLREDAVIKLLTRNNSTIRRPSFKIGYSRVETVRLEKTKRYLAKSAGLTMHHALLIKIKCLEIVLPYLHPRLSAIEVRQPGDDRGGVPSTLSLSEVIEHVERDVERDEG